MPKEPIVYAFVSTKARVTLVPPGFHQKILGYEKGIKKLDSKSFNMTYAFLTVLCRQICAKFGKLNIT